MAQLYAKRTLLRPMANRRDEDTDYSYDSRRQQGNYLRELRLKSNLTQKELADLIATETGEQVGNTAISSCEVGRNSISPSWYEALVVIFKMDRKKLGRDMLRMTNPYVFDLLYSAHPGGFTADLPPRAAQPLRTTRN